MTVWIPVSSKISCVICAKLIGNKGEPESHPKGITRHNNYTGSQTCYGNVRNTDVQKVLPPFFLNHIERRKKKGIQLSCVILLTSKTFTVGSLVMSKTDCFCFLHIAVYRVRSYQKM